MAQDENTVRDLTPHDADVLLKLQDPEYIPSEHTPLIDPSLPSDPHISSSEYPALVLLEASILKRIEKIEMQYSNLLPAPRNTPLLSLYLDAVKSLSELIAAQPNYASAKNNRAQAIRRLYGDGILVVHSGIEADAEQDQTPKTIEISKKKRSHIHQITTHPPTTKSAPTSHSTTPPFSYLQPLHTIASRSQQISQSTIMLQDLDTAISLLSPDDSPSPASQAISSQAAKTLSKAYTQRGAIYWLTAKQLSLTTGTTQEPEQEPKLLISPERKESSWCMRDFESAAAADFFLGGKLGNLLARSLAMAVNPMARLCGGIVRDAMRREMGGGEGRGGMRWDEMGI